MSDALAIRYSRGRSKTDNHPQQRTAQDFDAFVAALDRDRARQKGAVHPRIAGAMRPQIDRRLVQSGGEQALAQRVDIFSRTVRHDAIIVTTSRAAGTSPTCRRTRS